MPFILRDETAALLILYIDNDGAMGILGSANQGQALSLEGLGVIARGAYLSDNTVGVGASSPFAGTLVIPVAGISTVTYSIPQPPSVTSDTPPDSVTTTATTWSNPSSTSTTTVSYSIW